ncbi:MAG: TolC family protein [Acidobacteriaceae bacterium]
MKLSILAATFLLAAIANAQEQSMPGMNMPAQPKPKSAQHKQTPAKPEEPAKTDDSMPGMKMDNAPQSDRPPAGTDMMSMKPMHTDSPVTQAPGNGSITHDTYNLQEPDNPEHITGSNLPAPDLLKEVVHRAAIPLPDFIAFADKMNPTLAQANAFVQRSAAQVRQAGLYPNPTVGYQGEEIRGGSFGGGEHGGFVQQTVVLGGKLGLRRNIYEQQKRSDQIGVEEQTYRVHNDVTQAFYTALTSQAMVVVRQRLLGQAYDAVATVHELANVGQADAPDILQAEVEAEQVKIDYETAQREYIQNFRVLAAFSGNPGLPVSPLAGALEVTPEVDADEQVAAIVSSSPTVKRMRQEVAIREARLRDAKRESIPDLQLRAGEEYNFEHVTETPVKATGPQSFASVGVNIPLWNHNQGNAAAAQAEIERARKDVVREQLSLQRMAEPLAQSYSTARFTAERYKTQLIPRAQRAYQLYLTKYEGMAMAYPQVLVSQRTLFQLQIGYLHALHEVWMNAIALENFTLSGGLESPMSTGSGSTTINLPNGGGGPE